MAMYTVAPVDAAKPWKHHLFDIPCVRASRPAGMGEEYRSLYVLNVICIACEHVVYERSARANEQHLKHSCFRAASFLFRLSE